MVLLIIFDALHHSFRVMLRFFDEKSQPEVGVF